MKAGCKLMLGEMWRGREGTRDQSLFDHPTRFTRAGIILTDEHGN